MVHGFEIESLTLIFYIIYINLHVYLTYYEFLCSVYGEPIPIKELAERVASYVHLWHTILVAQV